MILAISLWGVIWKDCVTYMHGIAVYVKEGHPFTQDLYWLLFSSSLCLAFDGILCNKEEILSINPCSNVFVFGDFNIHHKDSLTYDGETNRIGELCHNFIQTINFPTRIPDCDSHSPLTVTLTVLLFLNYLFLLALVFFFSMTFFSLIMLLSQFSLNLRQTQK